MRYNHHLQWSTLKVSSMGPILQSLSHYSCQTCCWSSLHRHHFYSVELMKMPRSPSHPTYTTFFNFNLRNLPPLFWFLLTEPDVTAPMTFLNVQFCQSEVLLQTSSWPMPRKKTPLCVPRSFFPCLALMVKLI